MPQRKCCVSSCVSSENEGAVLHTFPNPSTANEKFRTWVTNAGLLGEDEHHIFKNRRICRLHFDKIYYYPKNRLNRLAIPTLHLQDVSQASDRPIVIEVDEAPCVASTSNKRDLKDVSQASDRPIVIEVDEAPCVASTSSKKDLKDVSQGSDRPIVMEVNKSPRIASPGNKRDLKDRPELLEFHRTLTKIQRQLKQCKNVKSKLTQKLKIAKKFSQSRAYNIVTRNLAPAAKTFFDMQVRHSLTKPNGRRFTLDEKILALALYKPSPRAYRLLSHICKLPKKSTLNQLMSKIYLMPGPNDAIFEHLKKRVDKMPNNHKFCTLIFDEMAITANLSYDKKNDIIKGFCDDGLERTTHFTDHVLVFMVRGIFKKYKQPVAFSFCSGTTSTASLKNQIQIITRKVLATGLKVVSTTCDQGSTNLAAINSLLKDTRTQYIKEKKEYRGGFFEIDGVKIYPIYDPPHLIKGIRNNLLTKDLQFCIKGKKHTAKWSHVVALYKQGPGFKGMRLVPKLTARHVLPNMIPKMKVKYCTQVFSKTVSVAMGYTAGHGRIPRESTDTAELLIFFDRLFDSVNGSFNKVRNGKIYKSAVSPKSPHFKLWRDSLVILRTMRYVTKRQEGIVPSISSWIKTIEAFQEITLYLHHQGLRSLLLRNFNQDPLENFFGAIRAHGHRNVMPTASSFEASYKSLLLNNMMTTKSVGSNCQDDGGYCLQSLKYFLTQEIARPPSKNIEIDCRHLTMELPNINVLINSQTPKDIEKCAAAAYCCGWIINIIKKNVSKNCIQCDNDLQGGSEESFTQFINLKKNTDKCVLHYPNKHFLEYVLLLEHVTIEILKTYCDFVQIAQYIELIATSLISMNFVRCQMHKNAVKNLILKKAILLILGDWCKCINNLLSGKDVIWDEDDPIKRSASEYYQKHRNKSNRNVRLSLSRAI